MFDFNLLRHAAGLYAFSNKRRAQFFPNQMQFFQLALIASLTTALPSVPPGKDCYYYHPLDKGHCCKPSGGYQKNKKNGHKVCHSDKSIKTTTTAEPAAVTEVPTPTEVDTTAEVPAPTEVDPTAVEEVPTPTDASVTPVA
jgi:hypothetical protein